MFYLFSFSHFTLRVKFVIKSITMASNYTEYSTRLSDQEESATYSEEKPETLLPRKLTESGSNSAEGDQGGTDVSQVENLRRRHNSKNGRKQFECDQCEKCLVRQEI